MTPRERELVAQLEAAFAGPVVAALIELVDERVAAAVAASGGRVGSRWLSLVEAAAYLRVSERTVERAIARGRLHSATLGRRRLLHRTDLDAFAQAATREETAPTAPPRRRCD